MSHQVLQCPLCNSPFQIAPEWAGQIVACPTCSGQVQIPESPKIKRRTKKKNRIEIGDSQTAVPPAQSEQQPQPTQSQPAPPATTIQKQHNELPETPSLVAQVIARQKPDETTEPPTGASTDPFVPRNVDHLLPSRFELDDPQRPSLRRNPTSPHEVFIPSADGGVQRINNRVVSVTHEGEKVQLRGLSDERRAQRRWIQNAIVFAVCLAILLAVFALLRKSV